METEIAIKLGLEFAAILAGVAADYQATLQKPGGPTQEDLDRFAATRRAAVDDWDNRG